MGIRSVCRVVTHYSGRFFEVFLDDAVTGHHFVKLTCADPGSGRGFVDLSPVSGKEFFKVLTFKIFNNEGPRLGQRERGVQGDDGALSVIGYKFCGKAFYR